jgi:uncharacterized protein
MTWRRADRDHYLEAWRRGSPGATRRGSTIELCQLVASRSRLCTAPWVLPQAPGSAIRWKWQACVRTYPLRNDKDCPAAHQGQLYQTFHMAYYLLEYALVDDYLARRAAFREEHLALAREARGRGDLILAGALAEPPDRAVLVWRTDDRSVVERFIDGDPYVRKGLVSSWTIRPWTVVIGEGAGQT